MTPFEIATEDIFANPDFVESATVGGTVVPVIASEISGDPTLSQFGLNEGISFFLRIRKSDLASPQKNDLVTFNGVEYRVDSFALDSSGLVWRVNLKSKSSR